MAADCIHIFVVLDGLSICGAANILCIALSTPAGNRLRLKEPPDLTMNADI